MQATIENDNKDEELSGCAADLRHVQFVLDRRAARANENNPSFCDTLFLAAQITGFVLLLVEKAIALRNR
ncbi:MULTISPECIES: hypothetical protein [unclassified Microcoleus]|uniref:hypothetical protein n=1 Tax=unclassified Microcoleus TaxID=2642155 RepID=UPI002FD50289